jgi:predicted nucleic acid-binding Zn ribbon protein
MAITQIDHGNFCLMCDDPLPKGKIFVCSGKCEDMSGVEDMRYPPHIPMVQQRQIIAKRIVARRKFLEDQKYHVMMDTRKFIQELRKL